MVDFLSFLAARVKNAFVTWPTPSQWGVVLALFVGFLGIALPIALNSGLATFGWTDAPLGLALRTAVIAFFAPSLLEETLYRPLFLPRPEEEEPWETVVPFMVLSTGLFVAGHPLAGLAGQWLLGRPVPALFFNPTFLALTTLFGAVSCLAYVRTGSIWPSVLMHWLLVVAWMVGAGGFVSFA